jgi:gluconate 2-dehydrogenase gamma chain
MLLGAVLLVGGVVALTRFTRKAAPGENTGPVLDADQFALLEQISEAMIPTTDTPGAIAAGVPQLMLELLTNWGNDESRAQIVSVLSAIEQRAWKSQGAAFLELPAEKRFEVVSAFDAEGVQQHRVAYRKFKQLVMLGYYHSEVGATQELRFELVPGAWRSCLPLTEVGRATAFDGG